MRTATTEGTTAATMTEMLVFDFDGEVFPDNEVFEEEVGEVDEAPALAPNCPREEAEELLVDGEAPRLALDCPREEVGT